MKKKILISTGGTGGHVIPAGIFFEHLKNDFDVFFTSDTRGTKFLNMEKEEIEKVKIINTPKLTKNLFSLPLNFFLIIFLTIKSFLFIKKHKINILISTGGYMSLPICISAKILNLKIYLFEPNMVLGRANIFFIKFSKKIFCYSKNIKNFTKKYLDKIITINPLIRKKFYSMTINTETILNELRLLVIGGSQGAEFFDKKIKDVVLNLSKKYKIKVYQQGNKDSLQELKNFYNSKNIDHEIFNFSGNISNYMSKSNLCITRAGASTLSELNFFNVPYLAVPYPYAKDNHQHENALFYKNKKCCWIIEQNNITSDLLTKELSQIIENKDDYLEKKKNMKNFSYQNSWKKINEKIIHTINEN